MCRVLLTSVLYLSAGSVLFAQSTDASLAGRVSDPSNAVIPGATITEYYLANLPPRSYRIGVEKTGFKTLIKPA
jgi:hypothetical protein